MPDWKRPAGCSNSTNCAEIALTDDGHVLIRDSTQPETVLRFTVDEWTALLAGVRNGEFDPKEES